MTPPAALRYTTPIQTRHYTLAFTDKPVMLRLECSSLQVPTYFDHMLLVTLCRTWQVSTINQLSLRLLWNPS